MSRGARTQSATTKDSPRQQKVVFTGGSLHLLEKIPLHVYNTFLTHNFFLQLLHLATQLKFLLSCPDDAFLKVIDVTPKMLIWVCCLLLLR